jgi:putative redox protein
MVRTEKVEFPGAEVGGQRAKLAGRLDLPVGPPLAYALFAHCFTCSKDVFAAQRISHALAERGIAVLRFDFTGLGHSGGEFANTHFSSNVEDLAAAADWLRGAHQAPQLLVGHSLGGAAVLLAAGRIPESRAVVTLNAPCDPAHVRHLFADDIPKINSRGEAEVSLAGRTFTIRKTFLADIGLQPMREAIRTLRKALLIFHAPQDQTVSVDSARAIYDAALHPKSFVTLDGADHLITRQEDAVYAAEVIAAWAFRYVTSSRPPAHWPEAGPGTVVVTGAGEGKFPHLVSMHGHNLRADEPAASGGYDSGPGPYDLLLAALGS